MVTDFSSDLLLPAAGRWPGPPPDPEGGAAIAALAHAVHFGTAFTGMRSEQASQQ
jgi:hypothetical protein